MTSAKIRHEVLTALAVAGLCVASAPAWAESRWSSFVPGGEWIVRGGVGIADPQGDWTGPEGDVLKTEDSDTVFVGDLTWLFTPNWGVEIFGTTPIEHKLVQYEEGSGDNLGEGSVSYIPWTLSLQYHFLPDSFVRPYLGAGVTYAWMDGDEPPEIDIDGDFGFGGGGGIDFGPPEGNWLFNVAVKYIDLSLDGDAPDGYEFTAAIDPLIYSASVGYRFGRAPAAAPVAAAAPPPPPPPAPAKCVDSDGDGVCDEADKCPDTPAGAKVDKVGCPLEQTLKVLFDFDSAELRPESITELERLVTFMGDVPFATALIEGHTDSVGTEAYNLALSDRRAKSVFDYLSSRGVDPARLSSVGHGELKPIADNATAEGRQLNRRVMLIRTDSGM